LFYRNWTLPDLTLIGDSEMTILLGSNYEELGATASDYYDGDLTNFIIIDGFVDTHVEGIYSITYSVTDSHNNSITLSRNIHVVNDVLIEIPDAFLRIAILDYLGRVEG